MDDIYNQIEKYLSGMLSKVEKEAFENKMKEDKDLSSEVDLFRDMMGGLRLRNNKNLKNRLNEIHEQEVGTSSKVRPIRWKQWLAAAAILLLLVTAYFVLRPGSPSPDLIYASHFEPYEPDWTSRGDAPALSLQQVKQLYENKQYENLLLLLDESTLQKGPDNVKITMLKGIAQLETNQYQAARQSFENVTKNAILRPTAQWYIALSYLKENKVSRAKELLAPFAKNANSGYHREALEILEELEN